MSNTTVTGAAPDNANKNVVIKYWAPLTDCASEINNTKAYNDKGIDVVMAMYNLVEYSKNYSKKTQGVYGNTIEINQF